MGSSGSRQSIAVLPSEGEANALLGRIRPNQDRLELAREFPVALRKHLQKSKKLQTVEPHTRLAGSYGRRVSTHQIKDVDIVVFVDPSYRALGVKRVLADLESAAAIFEHRRKPGAIDRRAQRRSVRVAFKDEDFYIDLVPAIAPEGPEGTLEIPDRERGKWVRTASVGYGAQFSALNAKSDEKLVPLVLLLRHWALLHCEGVRIKGFWLEALAVHLMKTKAAGSTSRPLLAIAADMFDAMHEYCRKAKVAKRAPVIPDPVLTTMNVAALWEKDEFDAFFSRLEEAHESVATVRQAKDAAQAIAAWQELFGAEYLVPTPMSVRVLRWVAGLGGAGGALAAVYYLIGRRR